MSRFKRVRVPLTAGLDQGTSSLEGEPTSFGAVAQNVEFGKDGTVQGRPGYVRTTGFGSRPLISSGGNPVPGVDTGVVNFAATGYLTPNLFTHKDAQGERPGLAAQGRVWTYEGDRWADRLGWAAASLTRGPDVISGLSDTATGPSPVSWDFGLHPSDKQATLFSSNQAIDGAWNDTGNAVGTVLGCGGAAYLKSGGLGISAAVYGDLSGIHVILRNNQGYVLTDTILTGTAGVFAANNQGNAPSICASVDAQVFWVAWTETGHAWFNLARVSPTTGQITSSVVKVTTQVPRAIWVDNSSQADNVVVVAIASSNGMESFVFNATTLADLGFASTAQGGATVGQVTVGAIRNGNCWIGWMSNGSLVMTVKSVTSGGAAVNPYIRPGFANAPFSFTEQPLFALLHQPITVGGRDYVGIQCLRQWQTVAPAQNTATWMVLDLTDVWSSVRLTGTAKNPTVVASGPIDGTAPAYFPVSAMLDKFSQQSYRFPTIDWHQFSFAVWASASENYLTGSNGGLALNTITPYAPQFANVGPGTVTAGCVPHYITSGACSEVGFPYLGYPKVQGGRVAGAGAFLTGSYTAMAVWRWTDEAGQVHRSAPSLPATFFTAADTDRITLTATNCLVTEREGPVYVEFYLTDTNPTADSFLYLQSSVLSSNLTGMATVILTGPTKTAGQVFKLPGAPAAANQAVEILYTAGGVLDNNPVNASAGIVTVGRRAWASDGRSLYPSKYLRQGRGPAWNTAGLSVPVPEALGRVVALTSLDDKLVVMCDRSLAWMSVTSPGDGPDDTATGQDFIIPQKISSMGLAGPRACVATPKGILFQAANTASAGGAGIAVTNLYGGLWLLDRAGALHAVGHNVVDFVTSAVTEMAYSAERGMVFIRTDAANVVVLDERGGRFSSWTTADGSLQSIATSKGILWSVGTEPGSYSGASGSDVTSTSTSYAMQVVSGHFYADGESGLGWARVRSIRVLGELGTYSLTIAAKLDMVKNLSSGAIAVNAAGVVSTWPTDRVAPEWRLPQQKCAQIQVTLTATPATATWSALELELLILGKAPAGQRV